MHVCSNRRREGKGRRGAYICIEEEQTRRNVMWCRKKIRLKLFGNTPTKRKKEGRGVGRPYRAEGSKGQKKKKERRMRGMTLITPPRGKKEKKKLKSKSQSIYDNDDDDARESRKKKRKLKSKRQQERERDKGGSRRNRARTKFSSPLQKKK